MIHEYLMFWLRETMSNIFRNRLMSILAVSTVTIGLFILGAFYFTVANLKAVVESQSRKLDIDVMLARDVSAERRKEIYDAARIPQVDRIVVVMKDQALKDLQRDMPKIPMSDFQGEQNPLHDELRIKLKHPEDILKVQAYLKTIKGVDDALAPTDVVRQILELNRIISVAGVITLFVLGLAILLIIHNAIRLTIFARRREINIMELVGATSSFISLPFLLEGIVYGGCGAVLAMILLSALFGSLGKSTSETMQWLLPLSPGEMIWRCAIWIIAAGLIFGFAGSWISISRSLREAAQN